MGPQHESCGKVAVMVDVVRIDRLQWGRNMRVAERCIRMMPASPLSRLQWGRNMRVAESIITALAVCSEPLLQWGRNMRVAESLLDPLVGSERHDASMGPQHESCGKLF